MVNKKLSGITHFFSKSIVKKIKRKKPKNENKDPKGHQISFDNNQAINIDEELNQDEFYSHKFRRLSAIDSVVKDARICSKNHTINPIDTSNDDEVIKNSKPKKLAKIKKKNKILET